MEKGPEDRFVFLPTIFLIIYRENANHQMTGRCLVVFSWCPIHIFLVIDLLYSLLDLNSFRYIQVFKINRYFSAFLNALSPDFTLSLSNSIGLKPGSQRVVSARYLLAVIHIYYVFDHSHFFIR